MSKVTVRPAVPADLDYLVVQLKAASENYGTKRALFDEEYIPQFMRDNVANHLVLVAESEEFGLMGFICGYVTNHLYNPKIKLLAELFWWVEEQYRNGTAAFRLLNEFVAWGKMHADMITFGTMETTPLKERALTDRGFRMVERSYLLEVGCP